MERYTSASAEETVNLGKRLGKQLRDPCVVCFKGDLAAGKTTFIKGLVQEASGCAENQVCSPTFVYLNIYEGGHKVFHFDLYRLRDADEFLSMGFDEFFSEGICCIEWAERIENIIPPDAMTVDIVHAGADTRHISIDRP